ncbi:MAG: T9SS type A sorting domain-containing protein, partial [Lentimicrobium sp.]|nr:T9SS type A sorting domain-containing protein [Lentimicrobium sp.]
DTVAPIVPTLANVTAQCSITPVTPTTTDACAGTISGTTSTVFPITSQGTTIVTWTFNDGNGQSVTANQNVIIDDTVAPICITKDITITLGSTITANDIDNGSSDNCGINTMVLSKYTFNTAGIETVTLTVTDFKGNTSSATAQVTIESSLGIKDLKNNLFVIYPIPFNNQINIDFPSSYSKNSVYIQIYNMNGKIIYDKKHSVNNQGIQINDLSIFSDGGYFIYLLDENQKIIQKKHVLKKTN